MCRVEIVIDGNTYTCPGMENCAWMGDSVRASRPEDCIITDICDWFLMESSDNGQQKLDKPSLVDRKV